MFGLSFVGVGASVIVLVGIGIVVVFSLFVGALARRYVKVGPNEALIISGVRRVYVDPGGIKRKRGFRIVKGGGAFVWPILEKAEILSLEVMTLDVKLPEIYTKPGVPVMVDGVAQIKVKGDDVSIATAAEQFLGKSSHQIAEIALQTVEGHLRAIVGTLTVEEIYRNREAFAQRVQDVAASDLANMGLTVVSFQLRDIRDKQGYLDALGKPQIAAVRRDAVIAQAEADRDATIKSALANQAAQEAKYQAEIKIAEANRDFEIKKAEYLASIGKQKAEADLAYDLQKYRIAQAVKEQEVQVTVVDKQKQIDVQEKEVARREKELLATVYKPAEAEKYKIETLAEAQRTKILKEAEGQAEAKRVIGIGEAEAEKAKGLAHAAVVQATGIAEAEVIKAKGFAEAEAMRKKADAWQAYNQAAIVQMFMEKLPEICRAIAEPLARTERIVVINTGGDSAGTSKITKDVVNIAAQVPPLLEALSGINLQELLSKIPAIGEQRAAGETKK